MSESAHTPLPWRRSKNDFNFFVVGSDDVRVVETSWHSRLRKPYPLQAEAKANVDFIIRVANSHSGLLEALKSARRQLVTLGGEHQSDAIQNAVLAEIDAVIAKAEGKQ